MTTPRAAVANAGDEEQVRGAARREKDTELIAQRDLRELLALPSFKRFVLRTIDFCGPLRTPFAQDDRWTTLNIGRSDVGRYLIIEVEQADPEAYLRMRLEAHQAEQREARVTATTTTEDKTFDA